MCTLTELKFIRLRLASFVTDEICDSVTYSIDFDFHHPFYTHSERAWLRLKSHAISKVKLPFQECDR